MYIFQFHPLPLQSFFSGCLRALFYPEGLGYNINKGAKFYILGRPKVFSSVATYFGPSTIGNDVKYVDKMCTVDMACADFLGGLTSIF